MEAMAIELMGAMEMDVGMDNPVCNAFFALQTRRERGKLGWDQNGTLFRPYCAPLEES